MAIRSLIIALLFSLSSAKLSDSETDSSLGWTYLGNLTSPVPGYTFLMYVARS